jgi:predicted nucleic acid-binding protein
VRILVDTGIWFRFVRRLPLSRKVETMLDDGGHQRYLCPISSMELVRKWRAGRLPYQKLTGFPQRYFKAVPL